jgi:uncharacterized membrane protein (UPF0127 family)
MYRFLFLFSCLHLFSAQIQLGQETLTVEIADTLETVATGLMHRKELPEGQGMLFIYPKLQIIHMWMKNTLIPLSVGFFDKERVLINVGEMEPHKGRAESSKMALYALELPKGWFARHKIAPGVKFSFLDQSDQIK